MKKSKRESDRAFLYALHAAMMKFADDQPLTEQDWQVLSCLTMIDKERRYFGPDNIRWAQSDAERADNLAFYQSLEPRVH